MVRMIKSDIKLRQYLDSIRWCLSYPFIKVGLIDDPWEKAIYDIITLENKYGARSTFFFIPFKDKPGHVKVGIPAKGREAKYDVRDYKSLLCELESKGWEVGVHGIDAHISENDAKEELHVIKTLLPNKDKIGLRMHWLYQSENLWKNLKEAGFYYDATFGSNDEAGFPDGKYQPFKQDDLWVIPLNIQDGTLLADWHKGLSLKDAWIEIEKILTVAKQEKAIVTVLWHTNVFGVYNYWGKLYEKILQKAIFDNARIMKCIDVINEMEKGMT
ncbi:MAG: hypothetical protein IT421_00110 [Candidatus Brocadia sp.]|nr:hypothetical protein [Candidatus Brocadia sp.]